MDTEAFPLVHTDKATGLTFVWYRPTATTIEITREEVHRVTDSEGLPDAVSEFHTDQCIGVYDGATGKIDLDPTHEAFEARVREWIKDNQEDDR